MKAGGNVSDVSWMSKAVNGMTAGFRTAVNEWFGPSEPLTPVIDQQTAIDSGARGRQYDYLTGFNLRFQPRSDEPSRISFSELRQLADSYDLLRAVIETCKDEIEQLDWCIRPKDKTKEPDSDPRCKAITEFLQFPDQDHTYRQWIRALLEDMYVLDAASIYPRKTKGGQLYSLDIIDGATVKRIVDASGRTPLLPNPAYQQILKGVPAASFTREELIYHPRNYRSNRFYGMSAVEQVTMTVNIALRRQIHQLQYYTEGNIPEAMIGVPKEWNPDQIRQFQDYWDSLHEGNTANRRHAKFVPGEIGKNTVFTKEAVLKDEYDEWLARIICYFFSQSPTPFIKQMNRATAGSSAEQAKEQGKAAVSAWLADLMTNRVLRLCFDAPDLEFSYAVQEDIDPMVQAQINQIYLQEYVVSPDEIRDQLGLEGPAPEKALPPMMGQPTVDGGGATDGDNGGKDGSVLPAGSNSGKGAAEGKGGDTQRATTVAISEALDVRRVKKKSIAPIDRDRDSLIAISDDFQGDLSDFFDTEAGSVATQISAGINEGSTADQILEKLDFSNWSRLIEPGTKAMQAAFTDGIDAGFAQIGITPTADMTELVNQAAVEYANLRGADYVGMWNVGTKADPNWVVNPRDQADGTPWAITDSTRDMVRGSVTQAMEEGWSNDKLAANLRESVGFNDYRANMVARTETAFADSYGNLSAYKASGVVEGKEWLCGSEHDLDDECDQNEAAGVIGLDEDFPDGSDCPPAHPHCICCMVPVVMENDE